MKIGIGTVQFGLDYGISNSCGITGQSEIEKIVDFAGQTGITLFDTAPGYGDSEQKLGLALQHHACPQIVTKLAGCPAQCIDEESVRYLEQQFHRSLSRLQQKRVYGLLIHDVRDIRKKGFHLIIELLNRLREAGLVQKIGASIYTPGDIDLLLETMEFDLIQVPFNIFDQRLHQLGYLNKLKSSNVEIHARSCFLQGLLLMPTDCLPQNFNRIKRTHHRLHQYLSDIDISPVAGCVGFTGAVPAIDRIICGVNNQQQLEEIVNAASVAIDPAQFADFALVDETILNPAQWGSA